MTRRGVGRGAAGERGTVTLWVLGLCIALMFLGGLSVDLWRAVAARRELSLMADTAATAAATGVDIPALRAGTLALDPVRARAIALASIAEDLHGRTLDAVDVSVVANRVTVTLRDHVDFSLLGIFLGGKHFDIEAHAAAVPTEQP